MNIFKNSILFLTLICLSTTIYGVTEIEWSGCGILKKAFITEMVKGFEKEHPDIKINVKGGGATKGIRDAAAYISDFGGSCRHKIAVPEEKNTKLELIVWDALSVIVSKDNPITDISLTDLMAIYSGKIRNWNQLNG